MTVQYSPDWEWETYCDNCERSWRNERDNSTCGDCAHCVIHDTLPHVGWCYAFGEFVDTRDCPSSFECDQFNS